jgi:hypothetical protein
LDWKIIGFQEKRTFFPSKIDPNRDHNIDPHGFAAEKVFLCFCCPTFFGIDCFQSFVSDIQVTIASEVRFRVARWYIFKQKIPIWVKFAMKDASKF